MGLRNVTFVADCLMFGVAGAQHFIAGDTVIEYGKQAKGIFVGVACAIW